MGFIKNSKYGIEVFLTDIGMEKLFLGEGLKNAISYFTLGTSEGDYRAYMNSEETPLEFIVNKGDFINGYYVDPDKNNSKVTINNNNLTRIAGKTQYAKTFDKQIFRTAETTFNELIIYYPDFDTHTTYTFDSFKNGLTGKKYFNLGLNTYPAFPLVIGGNNMYELTNTGGMKHQETKNWGYITTEEITGISNITKANNYPFPGVGVGIDTKHNKTEFQKFEIVNKSSQTIYLYNYNITEIVASKSHKISNVNLLYNNQDDPATSGNTLHIAEYIVTWTDLLNNTREDGRLRIKADKDFLLGTKETLLPFEVVEFWVQYEVSPDDDGKFDPAHHYHGQTSDNKNRKEGQISFNFTVNASKTKIEANVTPNSGDLLTTNVGIIIQVKDDTFEIIGLNPIQTAYITDESLNGGSPCSATYTTGIIYAPIGQTISDVYTNNLAGVNDYLRLGRLLSSNSAKSGYYTDIDGVTENMNYQLYYWNGTKFTSSKSYICDLYNVISVYYLPITKNPGEFISYSGSTIYCSEYNSLDTIYDGNTDEVYNNDYSKTVIENGYYVQTLDKNPNGDGSYVVYRFINSDGIDNKWTKLTFTTPEAIQAYYSAPTNDPCDVRDNKYSSTVYYENKVETTDSKFYTTANNTELSPLGYYVLKEDFDDGKPYQYDVFTGNNFTEADGGTCDALELLTNTYFSTTPGGPYTAVSVYNARVGVTDVNSAYTANSILFANSIGSILADSGYYITTQNNPPHVPYHSYEFDKITEKWVADEYMYIDFETSVIPASYYNVNDGELMVTNIVDTLTSIISYDYILTNSISGVISSGNITADQLHITNIGLGDYTIEIIQPDNSEAYKSYDFTMYSIPSSYINDAGPTTQTNAVVNATIYDSKSTIVERGICWSSDIQLPTLTSTDGQVFSIKSTTSSIGSYSVMLTNLTYLATYYIRAYAKDSNGNIGYSAPVTMLQAMNPSVVTGGNVNVIRYSNDYTKASVIPPGTIGGGGATEYGYIHMLSSQYNGSNLEYGLPYVNYTTINSNDYFTGSINGALENLTEQAHTFTAYAKGYNNTISYGEIRTINPMPVIINNISSNETTKMVVSAEIRLTDLYDINETGICWVVGTGTPSLLNNSQSTGTVSENFTITINTLSPNTTYSVSAYAKSSLNETTYSVPKTITTPQYNITTPTLTTIAVSDITNSTAISGGQDINAYGQTIIAKGVCWVENFAIPTITDNKTEDGTGVLNYTSTMTGLTNGLTYTVRAYATNDIGETGYGNSITFKVETAIAGVTTASDNFNFMYRVSWVDDYDVVHYDYQLINNTILNSGGLATTYGAMCMLKSNYDAGNVLEVGRPYVNSTRIDDPAGYSGLYTTTVTGSINTISDYVFRAYATNSKGTVYGNTYWYKIDGSVVLYNS